MKYNLCWVYCSGPKNYTVPIDFQQKFPDFLANLEVVNTHYQRGDRHPASAIAAPRSFRSVNSSVLRSSARWPFCPPSTRWELASHADAHFRGEATLDESP